MWCIVGERLHEQVHRIVVEDDTVAGYRMLAPTEWNFHPGGAVVQALSGLRAGSHLVHLATLLVEAVDPCVGYDIEISPGA